MIEPTETEPKCELDLFIDALISIAGEVDSNPELVLKAPHMTRTSRVDEVTAAPNPGYELDVEKPRQMGNNPAKMPGPGQFT